MAMSNILFNEGREEIEIFLCAVDKSMSKRICSALQIASGTIKCKTTQIDKVDDLMAYDLSEKDILIADKSRVQEFSVNQIISLMDESPRIIWISSEEKFLLSDLVNEIQSAV